MWGCLEAAACLVSTEGFDGLWQELLEGTDHLSLRAYLGGTDNRTPKGRNVRKGEDAVGAIR